MTDFQLAIVGFWLSIIAINSCASKDHLRDIDSAIRANTARCK